MMNFIYISIEAFACLAPLVVQKNDNATSTTIQTGVVPRW
jgi:hypothetical protein